ncbi:hypothetical protein BOTBODRAFT_42232 [Botryobasidium botryosum FD-172 SS1]|uniref:DUF6532 domain-containing protein n=1 Tax=Botryobasidium botryosum (strain FD-172 SS1) TaxID=930990 RepID=A0A067N478_BOTB1|nr:hypothetical protein BOTBODRAFT_42232 [Botryobasidium botryosum FD-172 SS1]
MTVRVIELEDIHIKIICKSMAQMRGELKTIARGMVEIYFGFHDRILKRRENRELYKKLITEHTFLYEDHRATRRLWFNPLLFKLIKRMFFKNQHDNSMICRPLFNPIRCALDEWSDGIWEPIPFTTPVYKPIYEELFAGLTKLKKDGSANVIKGLGQELWDESISTSISARFAVTQENLGGSFSAQTNAATITDYQQREHRRRQETNEAGIAGEAGENNQANEADGADGAGVTHEAA